MYSPRFWAKIKKNAQNLECFVENHKGFGQNLQYLKDFGQNHDKNIFCPGSFGSFVSFVYFGSFVSFVSFGSFGFFVYLWIFWVF